MFDLQHRLFPLTIRNYTWNIYSRHIIMWLYVSLVNMSIVQIWVILLYCLDYFVKANCDSKASLHSFKNLITKFHSIESPQHTKLLKAYKGIYYELTKSFMCWLLKHEMCIILFSNSISIPFENPPLSCFVTEEISLNLYSI